MKTSIGYLLFLFGLMLAACSQGAWEDAATSAGKALEEAAVSAEATAPTILATSTLQPTTAVEVVEEISSPMAEPIPTHTPPARASHLPVLGAAPDIVNETWLNTDGPLTLEGLQGKVVLVEFWTFG
ncbi:MAG: hypothetical protein ACPG8W_20275 [Candidatus Promineifilaceae bacterium]